MDKILSLATTSDDGSEWCYGPLDCSPNSFVDSVSGCRKKVAKGGRVAVHQAYKTPKELPESLMPPDVKEFHERFGEDGRNLEEFGQAITPMQKNGDDKATIKYSRRGKRGNQADQLQKDMVNDSAPSEKLPERRSARLKTQAVAPSSTPLGFRVRKKRTILK